MQIVSAVALAQYETAWAAILVASMLGIAFYAAVALVERLALSWHPSDRGTVTDRSDPRRAHEETKVVRRTVGVLRCRGER